MTTETARKMDVNSAYAMNKAVTVHGVQYAPELMAEIAEVIAADKAHQEREYICDVALNAKFHWNPDIRRMARVELRVLQATGAERAELEQHLDELAESYWSKKLDY